MMILIVAAPPTPPRLLCPPLYSEGCAQNRSRGVRLLRKALPTPLDSFASLFLAFSMVLLKLGGSYPPPSRPETDLFLQVSGSH